MDPEIKADQERGVIRKSTALGAGRSGLKL